MITGTNNSISNLKNLWIEIFMDKTNKVTNVADGSVLNATAYGTAKVAQKAIKDIAIVESQIFPESATGSLLDKSAALFGVTPRKGALGSSTYVRVMAAPGTVYDLSTYFIAKNGTRFIVDKPLTVDASGYGYVSVRSTVTGSATNVEANSITQVTPRPLQHIECTNEYQAVGGRDYEDDETFRIRIKNNDNKLSKGTVEYWTQVFQDLDPRVLRVMNVGLGEDAKTHIYLVTQNGSFFTEDELSTLLEKASSYFGLFEIDLSGNSIGIVLENAEWMYVGGSTGIDFRVELTPGVDITTVRTNIQIALTKYLDFRFWTPGKSVQWDDLLQVVKTATGVKYVPDEYFNPFYDESVPLNQLPRIRGFVMRDLNGSVLFDSGMNLSNIFYPASSIDTFTGQQSQTLSQTQLVQVTVTNTRGAAVVGATFTVGNKIVITNSEGQASLLLGNGEYDYILDKPGWNEQKGNFVVLNSDVFITINNFTAVQQQITFNVFQGQSPVQDAQILISNQTLVTNSAGAAIISLEPSTYSYTISKTGLTQILGAVVVDNEPITITEYMVPQPQEVAFSVIDRKRNIFVPEASVWIQDQTKTTDLNGQAEIGLPAGNYNMIVQKPGYVQYQETIQISDTKQNCVLVELQPTPYQVTFTVLDIKTNLPISAASVSIDGQNYQTNGQGIAVAGLVSGEYPYTVFKSGYVQYTGSVVVDGSSTGVIVRLDTAYQKITFIIRATDTGELLSGALVSANTVSAFSDVNGNAVLMLTNGTYNYTVSLAGYKVFTGTKTVLDAPSSETVFLLPEGHKLSFNVKDRLTSANLAQATVKVTNSGTGEIVATKITNTDGTAIFDNIRRGTYNYVVTKDSYIDSIGSIEMPLEDTAVEVLMDLKPITLKVLAIARNEVIGPPGASNAIITGVTAEFTNTTTGEVISAGPTTYETLNITLKVGNYSVKTTGPSIYDETQEMSLVRDGDITLRLALKDSIDVYFGTDFSEILPAEPSKEFFFNTEINVHLQRTGVPIIEYGINRTTIVRNGLSYLTGNSKYLYGPPVVYQFQPGDELGVDHFLWKYYSHIPTQLINDGSLTPVTSLYPILLKPGSNGVLTMILKDDAGGYLEENWVFNITLTRTVADDYPLTISRTFVSENRNGVVIGVLNKIPWGSYNVEVVSTNQNYTPADIFTIDISYDTPAVSKELVFPFKKIRIYGDARRGGYRLTGGSVQIIDLPSGTILAGPANITYQGTFGLDVSYRDRPANLNVPASYSNEEYIQEIELTSNQRYDIDLKPLYGIIYEVKGKGGKRLINATITITSPVSEVLTTDVLGRAIFGSLGPNIPVVCNISAPDYASIDRTDITPAGPPDTLTGAEVSLTQEPKLVIISTPISEEFEYTWLKNYDYVDILVIGAGGGGGGASWTSLNSTAYAGGGGGGGGGCYAFDVATADLADKVLFKIGNGGSYGSNITPSNPSNNTKGNKGEDTIIKLSEDPTQFITIPGGEGGSHTNYGVGGKVPTLSSETPTGLIALFKMFSGSYGGLGASGVPSSSGTTNANGSSGAGSAGPGNSGSTSGPGAPALGGDGTFGYPVGTKAPDVIPLSSKFNGQGSSASGGKAGSSSGYNIPGVGSGGGGYAISSFGSGGIGAAPYSDGSGRGGYGGNGIICLYYHN